MLDTSDAGSTNVVSISGVEKCSCPRGYTGLSCEVRLARKYHEVYNNGWMSKYITNGWMPKYIANEWMSKYITNGWMPKYITNGWMQKDITNGWMQKYITNGWMPKYITMDECQSI